MASVQREITPLRENDCFMVFNRKKSVFSFPIHFHPEYEINFLRHAKGGKRIVGDHIAEINNLELVMVGPNLYHGWENWNNKASQKVIHEITIQFSGELFNKEFLSKNLMLPIRTLLLKANQGILFTEKTTQTIEPLIEKLCTSQGFDGFIQLQNILHLLSVSENQQLLTNISFSQKQNNQQNEKIERIYQYIIEHSVNKLTTKKIADATNMTVITMSRLIKKRTGKTFVDFVNEIRLGNASRLLIESNKSIAEICFEVGFNNLSNFNRIFKKKQNCTPKAFRQNFAGIKRLH